MAELRIVGKALNDLADEWHWVVLHDATEVEAKLYDTTQVDTICGILLVDSPQRVRLYDMGAPDAPTCRACLDEGLGPALVAQIESAIEEAEGAPVGAPQLS